MKIILGFKGQSLQSQNTFKLHVWMIMPKSLRTCHPYDQLNFLTG